MGALADTPNPWGALVTLTDDEHAADNDPSMPCRTSTERIGELEKTQSMVALDMAQQVTRLDERITRLQAAIDHLAEKIAEWEADS